MNLYFNFVKANCSKIDNIKIKVSKHSAFAERPKCKPIIWCFQGFC